MNPHTHTHVAIVTYTMLMERQPLVLPLGDTACAQEEPFLSVCELSLVPSYPDSVPLYEQ